MTQTAKTQTAKLFKNGRSQAVRLPKEFRFEGTEVSIRRDEATGEVVLAQPATQPRKSLQDWLDRIGSPGLSENDLEREIQSLGKLTMRELFQVLDWAEFPQDFMADRKTHTPRELDLF